MAFPKRARDSAGGAFQKQQQPNPKRHKPAKPVEPAQDEAEVPVEVDLDAQLASLKTYIHHAVKLLSKAIKTSKQFEVQKVARKLKQAREPNDGAADDKAVAETEAQLNAIKAISPDAFAPSLLSIRIGKLGFLRPHAAALQAALATPSSSKLTEPDGQSPEGKARNRLLTNKVLKEAWDEVSRAMAKRCGQEVEPRAVKEKEAKLKLAGAAAGAAAAASPAVAKGVVQGEQAAGEEATVAAEAAEPVKRLSKRAERAAKAAATKAALPKRSMAMDPSRAAVLAAAEEKGSGAEDEEEGGSLADDESEDEGPVSGSEYGDDESELEREMARLGGAGDGSDEDDGFFSADEDQDDDEPDSDAPPTKKAKVAPAPTSTKPAKAAKPGKERKPVTSSAFLPSLAAGYISYSDSDGEDAKRDREFDKVEKKERKNRRGQRARQAIWEKKYGSGAKHIAKANGTPAAPAKGTRTAKTKAGKAATAAAEADPEKLDARYQPFDPAKAAANNPNAAPVGERKAARPPPAVMAGEKMHPSWEAKKRAAEQAVLQKAAPQGKKITFD